MSVANHEASQILFPGLTGVFDKASFFVPGAGQTAYSGVMAEAVQTVAITSRVANENLLAIGNRGQAGFSKRYGGVDLTVDAVLTDNVNVSGAYGYELFDFEEKLAGDFELITTNSTVGKKIQVTGVYTNSITFNFNQNDNSTTSWGFVGDGLILDNYSVATSGAIGNRDSECVNPLTWDEIHLYDEKNSLILTGVQSATFTANFNRTEIFEIGQFEPYDRSVQRPYTVSVTLNTLANDVALVNWWGKFIPSYDPMTDCGNPIVIKVRTNPISGAGTSVDFIVASGLRPTTSTLNTDVGANSTVALTFEGTHMTF